MYNVLGQQKNCNALCYVFYTSAQFRLVQTWFFSLLTIHFLFIHSDIHVLNA